MDLTRDHVNNFWDTSTPINQTKSPVGTYTGPDAARVNNFIYVWIIKALSSFDRFNPHYNSKNTNKNEYNKSLTHTFY